MNPSPTTNIEQLIDKENLAIWKAARNNPTDSLQQAKALLAKSKAENYIKGIAWAHGNIGATHLWLSNYEEALEHTVTARDLLKSVKDFEHEADILYNLCVIFYFLGEYEKQITYAKEALALSKEIGYDSGQASAYNGIGLAYYTTNENEKAIEYLLQGKEVAERINDKATLLKILDSIGQSYFNMGKYDEALPYKSGCAEVSNETGEKSIEAYALDGIGEIHLKKKDYKKALEFFNKSLTLRQELGFKTGEAETLLHIGELYFLEGNHTEAKKYFEKAIDLADDLKAYEVIAKAHLHLSEHFESIEDYKAHAEHFKAYHHARDKFNKEAESKKLRTFELKGRLEQMKEEQALLKQSNERLQDHFKDIEILSEIGNEITATLNFEEIFNVIYNRLNSLMDASGIFIGILNEEEEKIEVRLALDHGKRDDYFEYHLHEEHKLPVRVVKEKLEVHINDYEKEITNFIEHEEVRHNAPESLILLPLMVKEKVQGVMLAQSDNKHAFSDHHFNILKSFANYCAIALENASLYTGMEDEVKKRTAELERNYKNSEVLSKIGQELISTLNFEDVTERLYKGVNKLMDASIFGVRLYDEENQVIEYKYDYEDGKRHEGIVVPMDDDDNYSVWCIKNKKEIFIRDNRIDYKDYVNEVKVVAGEFPLSLIFFPLTKGDKVIGLITVQSLKENVYTKYHLTMLKTLAHYTVIALENARHYEIMEAEVAKRTKEIVLQKEVIEEKNKHITDSIHYAKRIQDATLPDLKLMNHYLKESFVLFKPKDIVSGDFYWIEKKGDEILFAVVDCTGHGVPGAFLSLIGYNNLNKIVNEMNIHEPAKILEELNRKVYKTLQNNLDHNHIQDGMDMSICSLNTTTNELQFAGAYNPLYIVSGNTITEVKGDKISIGAGEVNNNVSFTNNVIQLQKDDCIYLFSDGYADQFGGPKGKKFKYSRFKELLLEMNPLNMEEQHLSLDTTITNWQGDLEQIDDVCVIGVKAS